MTGRCDLLWVTNIANPYRSPVYAALRRDIALQVGFLAESEPGRRWSRDDEEGVLLPTWQVPLGSEQRLYALRPFAWRRRLAAPTAAVVLPGWESPAAWQLRRWARRRGVATVAFYESTGDSHRFRSGPVAWARRWFFRHVDAVLTAGEATTRAVLALGVDPARVVTGFDTVDVERFAAEAAVRRARTPGRAGHRFLYVGQLIERKNVDGALRAFAEVREPGDELVVLGDGPLRPELEALATSLGISEAVDLRGYDDGDGLLSAYATSDTLVLPSTQEVWGLVVNEALASGLHVVVSSRAGVAASVDLMRGVFVADPDPVSLAAAMAASRAAWQGPVPEPEMLRHTPEELAGSVRRAVAVGQGR